MEEQKTKSYQKRESIVAVVLFLLFIVWCPVYLIAYRPQVNGWLFDHIGSFPAILHLVPIMGPIIIIGVIMGKVLPAKND